MQACFQEILPATGVDFVATLNFTPSTRSSSSLTNLVTARNNWLRIYEVREEDVPLPTPTTEERRLQTGKTRRGTEAVAGEIEMDSKGEGFVSVDTVKSVPKRTYRAQTTTRLRLLREHRLHGVITGLGRVQTLSTYLDKLDRLIISFKEAKISVVEWSDTTHDISTVSIHSYERAPQMMTSISDLYKTILRVDPQHRCASLLLPHDSLAILPFNQAQLDVIEEDQDATQNELSKELPYSPSFILTLTDINEEFRNVVDLIFLPGFSTPTIAILYQTQQTWTGRLKEHKDTTSLVFLTLPSDSHHSPTTISTVSSLPYDIFSLTPCPPESGLTGLVLLATNSIIYVEDGRKIILPVNGWAGRVGDEVPPFEVPKNDEQVHPELDDDEYSVEGRGKTLNLEGSFVAFPFTAATSHGQKTHPKALLVTSTGLIYTLSFAMSGHTVSKLSIDIAEPLGRGTIPSCIQVIENYDSGDAVTNGVVDAEGGFGKIFIGSDVGVSTLLKVMLVPVDVPVTHTGLEGEMKDENANGGETVIDSIDDDIYGDSLPLESKTSGAQSNALSAELNYQMRLSLLDSLPAVGPISDLTFIVASNGEKVVPELVAASGSAHLGGFSFFQNLVPMRFKRKLHALGGSNGIWEIPLRETPRYSGGVGGGVHPGCTSVIVSTDALPAPGLTRVSARTRRGDILVMSRYNGTTVGAGPFFQGTAILQVTTNSVRLLGTDGLEKQTIKDLDKDTGATRPKIRSCSISDPFMLFIREDNTLGLFIGDKGGVRRKDMTPLGQKGSRYSAACFFADESNTLRASANPSFRSSSKSKSAATTSLEAVTDAGRGTQWLMLCRLNGVVEIWTLPKLSLVFSTVSIPRTSSVCVDSFAGVTSSIEETSQAGDMIIDDVYVSPIGEAKDRHYLTVLFKGGQLNIYELVRVPVLPDMPSNRELVLPIQLFKTRTYNIPSSDSTDSTSQHSKKVIHRELRPFNYKISTEFGLTTRSGLFLIGSHPLWILGSEKSGVQLHKCQYSSVTAFTTTVFWQSPSEAQRDFVMHTEAGPVLTEWITEYNTDESIPRRSMRQGKAYSHVRYDTSLNLLLGAAAIPSKFKLYDEDGNCLWEPDDPDISEPYQTCSSLELISPEDGFVIDGYEFAWNEFVNSLEIVTLESLSTEEGQKEFIACGTTVFRGEDFAVKGATYVFEIVEVVPSPPEEIMKKPNGHVNGVEEGEEVVPQWETVQPGHHYRLKLLCKDECKGAVTAVCSMNGYLVSSMGQKIFVRAFELDERLVGVAFLDVGIYVSCLTSLKNLLLVGDLNRSVEFVAFQEDPFKLVVVSRDIRLQNVVSANFIYAGGEMGIVTRDRAGIVRVWGFDPFHVDSAGGQYLLLRSEFNTQTYSLCSIPTIERSYPPSMNVGGDAEVLGGVMKGVSEMMDDGDPRLKVLWGCSDGSINAIVPLATAPIMEDMELDAVVPTGMGVGMDVSLAGMPPGVSVDGMNVNMNMNMVPDMNPNSMMTVDTSGSGKPDMDMDMGDMAPSPFTPGPLSGFVGFGGTGADLSKRLHLLQGRLVRGVMHAAGLNPRAFRTLQTPSSTKIKISSTSKTVLDMPLLKGFYDLSVERQEEICKEIGVGRGDVMDDLERCGVREVW